METSPEIAPWVLLGVHHLRFPLGKGKLAKLITGSRDKELAAWGLDRNPAYGKVRRKQDVVKWTIEDLIREAYLEIQGEANRPVLALTERGRQAALAVLTEKMPPARQEKSSALPAPKQRRDPEKEISSQGPSILLDHRIEELLIAEPEAAKAMLAELRLFHPREIAARLTARFEETESSRVQARAVWAAGELCESYALAFLLRTAVSPQDNLRRLTASALGKVAAAWKSEGEAQRLALDQARQVLAQLAQDPATQVRDYAQKALGQFPKSSAPRSGNAQ